MAKNTPAFQFYPSDFIGGVTLLSDEATGVYIKLLSQLWIQVVCGEGAPLLGRLSHSEEGRTRVARGAGG